jgi:hypothetical protein
VRALAPVPAREGVASPPAARGSPPRRQDAVERPPHRASVLPAIGGCSASPAASAVMSSSSWSTPWRSARFEAAAGPGRRRQERRPGRRAVELTANASRRPAAAAAAARGWVGEERPTMRRCRCFLPFRCEPPVGRQTDARVHVPCPVVAAASDGRPCTSWRTCSTPELTERQSAWGKGASPLRQHCSTADTVALISGFAVSCAWTTGWTPRGRGSHPAGWAAAIFPPYEAQNRFQATPAGAP